MGLFGLDKSKKEGFTNQADIMAKGGATTKSPGICSQLANMYTIEYQLKIEAERTPFLSLSPAEIYKESAKMLHKQYKMIFDGKDGQYFAFKDYPFAKESIITYRLANPNYVSHLISTNDLFIARVPTYQKDQRGKPIQHAIAFGKSNNAQEKLPQCYYFNSNREGGAVEGDCDSVLEEMSKDLKRSSYINRFSFSEVGSIKRNSRLEEDLAYQSPKLG